MSNAALIAETVLGQDLTIEECELLTHITGQHSLSKGDVLFNEGSTDEILYIVVSGKLEVLQVISGDNALSIATLKRGALIGELSFIDGLAHSMRLISKTDVEVLTIKKSDFEALVEQQPLLTFHVMRAILRYSHKLQQQMNNKYLEMHRLVQNQYTATY
ncbi:MAG: cyclic nucleotide-binding domain-containing protein [Gammaproteobacteria bacterium]|nr:cyclic nucleotide-binding domain-containing protein [Gammaproteobacteria bacterium]